MDLGNIQMKWVTIEDYADRYKVSLSSLKKKIANGSIEYQLASTKYFIKDQPLPEQNPFNKNQDSPLMNLEEKHKELTAAFNNKKNELQSLRAEYEDLKNLVQWLEKDNKEMRYVLNSLHRMDKWMKDSSGSSF